MCRKILLAFVDCIENNRTCSIILRAICYAICCAIYETIFVQGVFDFYSTVKLIKL